MWDSLECVLSCTETSAHEVWCRITSLVQILSDNDLIIFYGQTSRPEDVFNRLQSSGINHFVVKNDKYEITYSTLEHFNISVLTVHKQEQQSVAFWESWIYQLNRCGLISARVYNYEQQYWQNAEDPIEFESAGREYSHLPMKSNGLPSPLTKMVIDISRNPGRRILRTGFVEAIGEVMWLSPEFFTRTGCAIDVLSQMQLLTQTSEMLRGLVSISLPGFMSDENKCKRVRSALFPGNESASASP